MIQGVAAMSNKRPNQDIKKSQNIALLAHQKSNIPRLRARKNLKRGLWKSVLYFLLDAQKYLLDAGSYLILPDYQVSLQPACFISVQFTKAEQSLNCDKVFLSLYYSVLSIKQPIKYAHFVTCIGM